MGEGDQGSKPELQEGQLLTPISPTLLQVGELWDPETGPAEPDYKSLTVAWPCPRL